MECDPELENLIRGWKPPESAGDLNGRMMARYRARRRSFWMRRLEFRVAIPAPLAVAGFLVLLVSSAWLISTQKHEAFRDRMAGFEPVRAPSLSVTRAEVSR